MKTITMDYDLYKDELDKAREEGFNVIPDLKVKLKEFLEYCNGYTSIDKFNRSRQELINILHKLESE